MAVRDLSYTESYMVETPFLFRVASPLDWTLFTVILGAIVMIFGAAASKVISK